MSESRVNEVLEEKGGPALKKAKKVILQDIDSEDLRSPLQYLAENWNDLLRPALISLSCEAVGGKPESTTSAACAMTLICSSMNIYDHIMDRTKFKAFVPTLPGKFGDGVALIIAGLIVARAFKVLYEDAEKEIPPSKQSDVNMLFQDFLLEMSEAEMANLRKRHQGIVDIEGAFKVLQKQAADIEACMKIGATIGCGSKHVVENLGRYGLNLGTIIMLREDLRSSLNLTVELADKMRDHSLPYTLVWSVNKSDEARSLLSDMAVKKRISPADMKKVVEIILKTGVVDHIKKMTKQKNGEAKNALMDVSDDVVKNLLVLIVDMQSLSPDEYFP